MIPKELTSNYYFKRLIKYCSTSIKCESEVLRKIKELEVPDEHKDLILHTLKNLKFYFSDSEYLDRFLENLSTIKGYSKLQLKTKLIRKGIPIKDIDTKLNPYFKKNEAEQVVKYIQKNFSKLTRKPKEKRLNYLISKGFGADLSKKHLKELDL